MHFGRQIAQVVYTTEIIFGLRAIEKSSLSLEKFQALENEWENSNAQASGHDDSFFQAGGIAEPVTQGTEDIEHIAGPQIF